MASIFTKIINNQMPCYKVAEDENFIAFLDINPNARGHTLCIPKKEIDDYLDLDDETFKDLMYFSKIRNDHARIDNLIPYLSPPLKLQQFYFQNPHLYHWNKVDYLGRHKL